MRWLRAMRMWRSTAWCAPERRLRAPLGVLATLLALGLSPGPRALATPATALAAPTVGTESKPALPCTAVATPEPLTALATRLLRSRTPAAWTDLQAEAERMVEAQTVPHHRACAHYLAGGAAFFRSAAPGPERAPRAAEAVAHLLAAAALDPDALRHRQAQARLTAAFARLGAVAGWAPPGAPLVPVALPPPPASHPAAPGWLVLTAPTLNLTARLSPPPAEPGSAPPVVPLRAGPWQLAWQSRCGAVTASVEVKAGAEVGLPLPPPAPCPVALAVVDADGAPVPAASVTWADGAEAGQPVTALTDAPRPVRIAAPGHVAQVLAPPSGTSNWQVKLQRCSVALQVETEPADAEVTGPGPVPWGRHRVRADRAGYAPLETEVEVPAPETCAGPSPGPALPVHTVRLNLARRLALVVTDAAGGPVLPSAILLDDTPQTPDAERPLAHPAGPVRWRVTHPMLGPLEGTATVLPCAEADCPPHPIEIRYLGGALPADRERPLAPMLTLGLGGLSFAAGLVAGLGALSTQRELDDYTTLRAVGVPVDTLADRRDRQALTADVLLGAGTALLVGGLVWYLLTDGP